MEDHAHNNEIGSFILNATWTLSTAIFFLGLLELRSSLCFWLSWGGGGTVAAIKCIHWQPGLTLPGGFLVHWVFLHYKARGLLVWGKVQKGLHYHCSGACSSNTFLVCKKEQWVLYYKGVFSPWFGALIHYKAISRLGKVQLKLGWMGSIVRLVREVTTEVGWNWWLKRLPVWGWMKLMVRLVEEVTTPQMRGRRERKGNCLPVGGGSMHGTLVKHSLHG